MKRKAVLVLGFGCMALGLYGFYGEPRIVVEQRAPAIKEKLAQHAALRPLIREITQQEYRMRIHLGAHPEDLKTLTRLARLYMVTERHEQARQILKTILQLAPNHLTANNWRAYEEYQGGNLKAALACWEGLVHLLPHEARQELEKAQK